jgi:hypothetical protein
VAVPYAIRLDLGGPDCIERAAPQALYLKVYDTTTGNGASVTTSGSTFTLYDAQGTAVVSAQAITVSLTEVGLVAYTLSSSDVPATKALGPGWRGVWSLVIDEETVVFTRDYALCRYVPRMALTQDDLYARHPELRDQIPPGQTTWLPQIHQAFREITQRIADQGRRYWLIVSAGSPYVPHLYLTLAQIFRLLSTTAEARWTRLADQYQRMFDAEWDKLRFEYDADDDRQSDGQESAQAVVYLSAGPRPGIWGRSWR